MSLQRGEKDSSHRADASAFGSVVLSLASSVDGAELLHRLRVACFSGLPWAKKIIPEIIKELELLGCVSLREFLLSTESVSSVLHYGVGGGVLSSTIENPNFARYLRYCDPSPTSSIVCERLKQLRFLVASIDKLFLEVSGDGVGVFRVLKSGSEVDWAAVRDLFGRPDLEYGFTFRNPRVMEALQNLEGCTQSEHCVGHVNSNLGPNILAMVCLCWMSGTCDRRILEAVKVFHENDLKYVGVVKETHGNYLGDVDVNSVLPLTHERMDKKGSLAYFLRRRFDYNYSEHSDVFSDRCMVFKYLRDQFRLGPLYRSDDDDD